MVNGGRVPVHAAAARLVAGGVIGILRKYPAPKEFGARRTPLVDQPGSHSYRSMMGWS